MMLGVELLEPLARDVRVDLRGRDVRMSEQELHHPQVGAVVDEVRREGVAQHVRRELLARDGARAVAPGEMPERLARHARTAGGVEQDIGAGFLSLLQVFRYPVGGDLDDRDQPLLRALAERANNVAVEVHLEDLQPDQLRHAQARGVEQLEHRPVAQAEPRGDVRRAEERFHVGFGERLGKARYALGRIEPERRIGAEAPLAHAILIEALERRHQPGGARGAAPARGHESEEILLADPQEALLREAAELLEIGAVGSDGVLREAVLEPQRVAERVEQRRVGLVRGRSGAQGRSSNSPVSCSSSQRLASMRKPSVEWPKPPSPLAATTRWQGITIGSRLSPQAWPIARSAL